jgi:hypothetical protein
VAQKRITLKINIHIGITANKLPECRIWPFLGPAISKFSRFLLIIVLEDGIRRDSIFALGPQISLGDPGRFAVHVDFGIILYINCSLSFGYTLLKGCVHKF